MGDAMAAISRRVRGDRALDGIECSPRRPLAAGMHVHVEPCGINLADELAPLVLGERRAAGRIGFVCVGSINQAVCPPCVPSPMIFTTCTCTNSLQTRWR